MRAITAPKIIFETSEHLKKDQKTIGLVPTMGALHVGHISLVEKSLSENDGTNGLISFCSMLHRETTKQPIAD